MSESREELESRIAAYIDGELPPAEAARLEVFLANTDPQLAEQVIGMLADKHRLRALPSVKAPPDLASRIMEQVERSSLLNGVEHFANPVRPWWQSRGFIAAITLLVIGGFSYFLITSVLPQESPWKNSLASSAPSQSPSVPASLSASRREIDKSGLPEKSGADSPIAAAAPAPIPPAASIEGKSAAGAIALAPAAPLIEKDARETNSKTGPAIASARRDSFGSDTLGGRGGYPSKTADGAASTDATVQTQLTRNRQLLGAKSADLASFAYAKTPSAQTALDAVLPPSNSTALEAGKFTPDQPVVLAFVARDPDDAARFQSRLEQLVASDASAPENQFSMQNHSGGQTRANDISPNAASNTPDLSADSNLRYYDDRKRAFTSNAPASNNENGVAPNSVAQNVAPPLESQHLAQQAPAPAVPAAVAYRVALTPDQLQTLSHEFTLRAVSRGQVAYAITPSSDTPKLKNAEHVATAENSTPTAAPASQPAADTAQPQQLAKQTDELQPAPQKQLAAVDPQKAQPLAKKFVDCIITIEPEKP